MRIVGGEHRGARIVAPRGSLTRPTSDRAREAAFNLIGGVEGAGVLDLFAGSGAMGLEALSRGAARCLFVDSDPRACEAIRLNLAKLRLTRAAISRDDALRALAAERAAGRLYDLVLVDPPYDLWEGLQDRLGAALEPVLAPAALVVVETAASLEPALPLDPVTSRRYGSARITLFTR